MGGVVTKAAFLPPPPTTLRTQSVVWLKTRSGVSIPTIYVKQPFETRFTILASHGNAEDLGLNAPWIFELANRLKVNFLAYEYPGYGLSHLDNTPVVPSEALCYEAVTTAFAFLTNIEKLDPQRIILMGRSLGTGPTVDLASRKHVGGVIIQSPLRSAIRVVMRTPLTLYFDIFANQDKIHKIHTPIFVIHGTNDEVINVSHGKYLHELIPKEYSYPAWFVENAGHNNIEESYMEEYFRRLTGFMNFLDDYSKNTKPPINATSHL